MKKKSTHVQRVKTGAGKNCLSFQKFKRVGLLCALVAAALLFLAGCASKKFFFVDPDSPDALQFIVANDYLMFGSRDCEFSIGHYSHRLPDDLRVPYLLRLDLSNETFLDQFEVTATWIGNESSPCCIAFPWSHCAAAYAPIGFGQQVACLDSNSPVKIWRGSAIINLTPLQEKILMSCLKFEIPSFFFKTKKYPCGHLYVTVGNRSQCLTLQSGRIVEKPFPIVSLSFYANLAPKFFDSSEYVYQQKMPDAMLKTLKEWYPEYFKAKENKEEKSDAVIAD